MFREDTKPQTSPWIQRGGDLMKKSGLSQLIDMIEDEVKGGGHSMLGLFQIGIALKVLDDRLWNIDEHQAQRCNDLCHYILEHK